MWCQLRVLPIVGTTWLERLEMGLCYTGRSVLATSRRLLNDPALVMRKFRRVLGISRPRATSGTQVAATQAMGLQPGDRVRVKSLAEIQATLDSHGRYEGMHYVPATMDRYCGGTYTVVTRVERFYDERSRRMLRMKNTVLLDRVYCQPSPDLDDRIAGCKRTCFCFWKEAWLERVTPPHPSTN